MKFEEHDQAVLETLKLFVESFDKDKHSPLYQMVGSSLCQVILSVFTTLSEYPEDSNLNPIILSKIIKGGLLETVTSIDGGIAIFSEHNIPGGLQ